MPKARDKPNHDKVPQHGPANGQSLRSESPVAFAAGMAASMRERVKRVLRQLAGRGAPAVGGVEFGDFARTSPISLQFGFDRGTPIDRFYIAEFLASHCQDIRGRVLEVGDTRYSDRFNSDITRQDVLHIHSGNPAATIVGDLSQPGLLPADTFDCIILVQTLQYVFDLPKAVEQIRQSLRPGGIALVTLPGISATDRGEWADRWYWRLSEPGARRLFEGFGSHNLDVEAHGNVYAATCFLHGLAVEEINREWLERRDAAYPVTVTIRARRDDGS